MRAARAAAPMRLTPQPCALAREADAVDAVVLAAEVGVAVGVGLLAGDDDGRDVAVCGARVDGDHAAARARPVAREARVRGAGLRVCAQCGGEPAGGEPGERALLGGGVRQSQLTHPVAKARLAALAPRACAVRRARGAGSRGPGRSASPVRGGG